MATLANYVQPTSKSSQPDHLELPTETEQKPAVARRPTIVIHQFGQRVCEVIIPTA